MQAIVSATPTKQQWIDAANYIAGKYKEQMYEMGAKSLGRLDNLVTEFTGMPAEDKKNFRNLKRLASVLIDQPRKRISDTVGDHVKSFFDKEQKYTKKQWNAVTKVFLQGDISSLIDLGRDSLIQAVSDKDYRQNLIKEMEANLRNNYGRNGQHYINQATGLGLMMATGKTFDEIGNQMLNAHNIVQMIAFGENKPALTGDLQQAEKIVDQLATLQSLEYTDPATLQIAKDVMQHEMGRDVDTNGIENLIATHAGFKEASLEKNFEGNKISVVKGYIKQNYDPNVSVAAEPLSKQQEMERRGYTLVKKLPYDPLFGEEEVGLYKTKMPLQRYRAGVVSKTNETHMGTSIHDSLKNLRVKDAFKKTQTRVEKAALRAERDAFRSFEPIDKSKIGEVKPVPIVNPKTGLISDYRYMMTEDTKQELLSPDNEAYDTMGKMFASVEDKVNTKLINRKSIRDVKTRLRYL